MRLKLLRIAAAILLYGVVHAEEQKMPKNVHEIQMNDIDGKPFDFASHKGNVLLIVNVASKCGYTPQYTGLQKLHDKYKEKGFAVIGVPANEFGKQEPGSNQEIKTFCSTKFAVTFPMLAKVVVKGHDICPLYKLLTTEAPTKGDITWNFNKFLVNRKGEIVGGRYESKIAPDNKDLLEAIEKALVEPK